MSSRTYLQLRQRRCLERRLILPNNKQGTAQRKCQSQKRGDKCEGKTGHESRVSMFMDFWSRLQMSLNCSCSLPTGRFPSASSPEECPLVFVPPPFYKHPPAITGVPVSIESTCLADFLCQEPQRWELCFARRCSKCV